MQDNIPHLIVQNRNRIIIAVFAAAALAAVLSLIMPKQYLSEASVLPANSKMMDKQALFGSNIQELYSAYGASEDLDRLMATMHSPTVLQYVADSLRLQQHYDINGKDARRKTLKKLEKQVKLLRTEYGEINIRVWDRDPAMAKTIADLMLQRTQQVYDELFTNYHDISIKRMQSLLNPGYDSLSLTAAAEQAGEQVMLINRIMELKVNRANPPAAMFVLAKPEQSVEADKPKVALNTAFATLAALFAMIAWIVGSSFWKSAYAKP